MTALANSAPSYNYSGAFSYDAANRITSASSTSYSTTFGYTADGSNGEFGNVNCTSASNAYCPVIAFNLQNNQITTPGFSYDAAGELLTDPNGNSYTWNAEGKTATVTHNGQTATYIYDGDVHLRWRRPPREGLGKRFAVVVRDGRRVAGGDGSRVATAPMEPRLDLPGRAEDRAMAKINATAKTDPVTKVEVLRNTQYVDRWKAQESADAVKHTVIPPR